MPCCLMPRRCAPSNANLIGRPLKRLFAHVVLSSQYRNGGITTPQKLPAESLWARRIISSRASALNLIDAAGRNACQFKDTTFRVSDAHPSSLIWSRLSAERKQLIKSSFLNGFVK